MLDVHIAQTRNITDSEDKMNKARIILGAAFIIAGVVMIVIFANPGETTKPMLLIGGIGSFFIGALIAGGKPAVEFLWDLIQKLTSR